MAKAQKKTLRKVPLISLRGIYRPGPDVLTYAAIYENAVTVKARVYGPNGMKRRATWSKVETGVFAIDFEFTELGNYIFVIEEDGDITTILNAKVYA